MAVLQGCCKSFRRVGVWGEARLAGFRVLDCCWGGVNARGFHSQAQQPAKAKSQKPRWQLRTSTSRTKGTLNPKPFAWFPDALGWSGTKLRRDLQAARDPRLQSTELVMHTFGGGGGFIAFGLQGLRVSLSQILRVSRALRACRSSRFLSLFGKKP